MSSSQFMDKKILGLSESYGDGGGGDGDDLLDLTSLQEGHRRHSDGGGAVKTEEILPSYDFQPILNLGSSPTSGHALDAPRSSRGSVDSKTAPANLNYAGILESQELTKVSHDKERSAYNVATVSEIDHTVKKYADNLMHALDDLSSRLLNVESRTHHLESSVEELKVAIGNSNGSTDGKLRQLDNIIREVQTGIQFLRNKQEIADSQLQLAKIAAAKGDHQTFENSSSAQLDTRQPPVPPQQSVQQPLQPPAAPPQPPSLPAPLALNASAPQQNHPSVPYPGQLTQTQIPPMASYFTPPAQSTDTSCQQYQMPSHQHQPPPPPPPPQPYQSAPQLPQYSQATQLPQPINPSQPQPPLTHQPVDSAPYVPPPQTYPPSIRQSSPSTQPPSGTPQQFYGPNPSTYEPPMNSPNSGQLSLSAGYGPPMRPPGFSDSYPYSGSPSHYSSSATASSGRRNNYQRLPTAQILPQAQPTASSGGATGNRLPIDDVVDKVVTMGFTSDQVRATVRRLTENGQSVDLNVVLDKLMNDGVIQPQKGWFGR